VIASIFVTRLSLVFSLLLGGSVAFGPGCGSSSTADSPGFEPTGESGDGGTGGVSGKGGAAGKAGGTSGKGGGSGQAGKSVQGGAGPGGSGAGAGAGGAGAGAGPSQGGAGDGQSGAGNGQGGQGASGAAGMGVPGKGAPYPIVLAHGFFGFEDFAGVDFITYFYKVKDRLEADGETQVFTPAVDPFNDSTTRGTALLAAVEKIIAETGAAKVNLIGHSQGGLDARVVAHLRPDLVASVTTFATPHHGTPVADVALRLVSDPNAQSLIDSLVKLVGVPLYDQAGNQTSLFKAFDQFSQPGIEAFNALYTDQPGIRYQSFAGRSSLHLGVPDCQADAAPGFVTTWNSTLDPLEPLLGATGVVLDGGVFIKQAHDGLVRVKDAKWGEFLGCLPADHFDEIGQLFGDSPGLFNDWKYLNFYSDVVKLIRQQGN
jgi:triacylglycerol lipase